MPTPQPGIFGLGTRAHHHLQFDRIGDEQLLLDATRRIRQAAGSVVGVNMVVGFGPDLMATIAPDHTPADLASFESIEGADGYTIPAEQHDLWLWLHGPAQDGPLDVARSATIELTGIASLVAEQQSFVYRSSLDLTGFEDGTENPPIDEALEIATVPPGQPGAGGSIVLVQRWVHDLGSFEALDVADRESVIGRTLAESVELDESVRPPGSHVSRVVIEDDEGEELQVFRRSTAFGGVQENGLLFVAFSADVARLQRMLDRMAGVEDGIRDELTNFSVAEGSAWYFAPPIEIFRE